MSKIPRTKLAIGAALLVIAFAAGYVLLTKTVPKEDQPHGDAPLVTLVAPFQKATVDALGLGINPATSKWESEIVAERITRQAKVISKWIATGKEADPSLLGGLATSDFNTTELRSKSSVLQRGKLVVHRLKGVPLRLDSTDSRHLQPRFGTYRNPSVAPRKPAQS